MSRAGETALLADVHESRSSVCEAVERLGVRVVEMALPVGDYDAGNGALVERKTVRDRHDSVVQGRFWRQLGQLLRAGNTPYLLVEGRILDAGQLSPAAVRGVCVAVMDRGVRVVRSDGPGDTARWLVRLVVRHQRAGARHRPVYAQHAPVSESAAEGALAAVPGISVVSARALLDRFGSVAGVASATPDELAAVPGIGSARATAIRATFHAPPTPRHSRRSAGPHYPP